MTPGSWRQRALLRHGRNISFLFTGGFLAPESHGDKQNDAGGPEEPWQARMLAFVLQGVGEKKHNIFIALDSNLFHPVFFKVVRYHLASALEQIVKTEGRPVAL